MRDEISELKKYLARVEERLEEEKQNWLDPALKDRLSRLEKKFFGFGREKLPKLRPVGHEKQEVLIFGERTSEEVKPLSEKEDFASVEPKICECSEEMLEEESKLRGLATGAFEEIPKMYEESSEITLTERTYTRIIHRRVKYRLKPEYNTTGKEVIIAAPGPAKLKAGCEYSIDFAVTTASDKYEYHLPLERQRRKMEEAGLKIDVKTLYSLCEAVAEHGREMVERIRKEIFEDFCASHLDESPWRILGGGENGYMWVLSNRRGAYYRFEPTRSGKVPIEMLEGYAGAIVTDAYGGYNQVARSPHIRVGHCWSHARREFYERYEDFPEAEGALLLIDELFDIERRGKTFEQQKELRQSESRETVELLKKWCQQTLPRYLPGDGIAKAIKYVLNHWEGLTLFLRDLSVPLTNNDAERALRHAVLGRKNFAGSKTINGADTAAILYTLIETAKRNGLHPKDYLRYLITERWNGKTPLTPMRYAFEMLGENKRIKFPEKTAWKI